MSLFQSFLVPCIHTAFSDVSLLFPVVLASCGSAEWDSRSNHRQLDEISANFAAARVWLNAGCRLFGELVQRLIGQNALAGSERVFCLHIICYTNKVYVWFVCSFGKITTPAAAAAVLGSQDQTTAEPARTPSAIRFVLKDRWFLLSWFSAAMVSVDIELPKSFAGPPPSKCCRIGLRFLPYLCLSQSALIYVAILLPISYDSTLLRGCSCQGIIDNSHGNTVSNAHCRLQQKSGPKEFHGQKHWLWPVMR